MLVMLKGDGPVFVNTVVFAGLVLPTIRGGNFRLKGVSFTVPLDRVTVAVALFVLSEMEVPVIVTDVFAGMDEGAV